jgi:signal peptidase I
MSHPSGPPDDDQPDQRPARRRDAAGARSEPRHLEPRGGRREREGRDRDGELDGPDPDGDEGGARQLVRSVAEWVGVIACGVVIALVAQAFLVQAFWIPSASMVPTLNEGDRVLVNKLAYRAHDVHRGDVIVFDRPEEAANGDDEIKDLIKRVVAIEGDTIELHEGDVYINGERIEEPYLNDDAPTSPDTGGCTNSGDDRWELPEDTVFVMGDNRTNSSDSRCFGPIAEDTIVGRAVVKLLPLRDVGWL